MNEYSFLLAIAAALLAGAMSPGPSFLIVAQNSLSESRAHGLATSVGTGLGAAVFALLAALGVTKVLKNSPVIFAVFSVAGAIYLLWIAFKIARHANEPLATTSAAQQPKMSLGAVCLKGFAVQVSNPKTVFVIASIFGALMPSEAPAYTALWVALIAFVVDFGWYAVVAISLSLAKSRAFYQKAKPVFDTVAALLLVLLALKLFAGLF